MRHTRLVIATALIVVSLGTALWTAGSHALPLYAARNGLNCNSCHFDPNGGGPRTEFGFNFAKNRHMLQPDTTGKWADLGIANRVAENVPVYFGINHRFMLLTENTEVIEGLDTFGFFNMENALHLTFQPHSQLTLVYTRDGFDSGSKSQDAFGMISGGPWDSYIKAGRFRTPFGLRMDDHTVATRGNMLVSIDRFLPYEPREPDMGVEIGAERGPVFVRAAFTNGPVSSPFGASHAEAKTLKLGYHNSWYMGNVSLYDDYRGAGSLLRRATRWSYSGLVHQGPIALLGEIAAGTDESITGAKTNLLAGFAEINYPPVRWINFRARFDHLVLNRSSNDAIRDLNTFHRYSIEGEVVPVPFAELRWTVRRIDAKDESIPDVTQGYLQFHFSY